MRPEQERKKSPSLWIDLALFAGAVLFCVYSFQALTRERPRAADFSPLAAADQDRRPASNTGSPREEGGTARIQLPCLRPPPSPLQVSARIVQLQAGPCRDPQLFRAPWSGKNERTGEELQLFTGEGRDSLTTSYFSLRPGRNRLVFSQSLPNGRTRTEALEINRTSADEE